MKNKIKLKEYFIMLHKSSLSRGSNPDKGKNKVTFSNGQEGFFNEIDINDIPSIMRQKIEGMQKIQQTRVIKVKVNPHGWIVAFYLSFMNIYFTDSKRFKQNTEKMYELLDNDEFLFFKTNNENGLSFTQWSNSKIKRLIAESINDVISEKYKTVTQIFRVNIELSKLLFLFSVSLLFYCEKIDSHEQFVDLQTVIEELFDYFNIELELGENNVVKVNDANVSVYTFHRTDLYVVLGQGKNGVVNQSNRKEAIRLNKLSSIDNETYDLKGEVVENQWFMKTPCMKSTNSSQTNKDKDNFYDLSNNQIYNTHLQSHSSINTFGANSNRTNNNPSQFTFRDQRSNEDNNRRNNNQKTPLINQYNKGKVILSTQGTQWTGGKNCEQHEIDKLFEMKSHQATTQKTIYDDPRQEQTPEVEYSFIDDNIPTRKSTIRKTIKLQQQQQNNQQQLQQEKKQSQNQTLMNKWYDFIRERRNKVKIAQVESEKQDMKGLLSGSRSNLQQRLLSSAKKILVQPSRLTSTQKPDFKKIKQQQRKRTTQQSQSQQKAFASSCLLKSMKSQKSFISSSSNMTYPTATLNDERGLLRGSQCKQVQSSLMQSRKFKQSIMLTPVRKQNKSMYMKEMRITEEFTNSLILEQLNEMNQRNVKVMKQKARKERASMGIERKERKTVK